MARTRPIRRAAGPFLRSDEHCLRLPLCASRGEWATECSDAPREVCERAQAHVNTNSIATPYSLYHRLSSLRADRIGS